MGGRQPPSPLDAAQDVSACLRARVEGGRTHGLPRLLTWPAEAGAQGGCISHPAGGAPD